MDEDFPIEETRIPPEDIRGGVWTMIPPEETGVVPPPLPSETKASNSGDYSPVKEAERITGQAAEEQPRVIHEDIDPTDGVVTETEAIGSLTGDTALEAVVSLETGPEPGSAKAKLEEAGINTKGIDEFILGDPVDGGVGSSSDLAEVKEGLSEISMRPQMTGQELAKRRADKEMWGRDRREKDFEVQVAELRSLPPDASRESRLEVVRRQVKELQAIDSYTRGRYASELVMEGYGAELLEVLAAEPENETEAEIQREQLDHLAYTAVELGAYGVAGRIGQTLAAKEVNEPAYRSVRLSLVSDMARNQARRRESDHALSSSRHLAEIVRASDLPAADRISYQLNALESAVDCGEKGTELKNELYAQLKELLEDQPAGVVLESDRVKVATPEGVLATAALFVGDEETASGILPDLEQSDTAFCLNSVGEDLIKAQNTAALKTLFFKAEKAEKDEADLAEVAQYLTRNDIPDALEQGEKTAILDAIEKRQTAEKIEYPYNERIGLDLLIEHKRYDAAEKFLVRLAAEDDWNLSVTGSDAMRSCIAAGDFLEALHIYALIGKKVGGSYLQEVYQHYEELSQVSQSDESRAEVQHSIELVSDIIANGLSNSSEIKYLLNRQRQGYAIDVKKITDDLQKASVERGYIADYQEMGHLIVLALGDEKGREIIGPVLQSFYDEQAGSPKDVLSTAIKGLIESEYVYLGNVDDDFAKEFIGQLLGGEHDGINAIINNEHLTNQQKDAVVQLLIGRARNYEELETNFSAETQRVAEILQSTEIAKTMNELNTSAKVMSDLMEFILTSKEPLQAARDAEAVFRQTDIGRLIGPNGPAETISDALLTTIFSSKDPLAAAHEISTVFAGGSSLWYQLYRLSEINCGEVGEAGFAQGLVLTEIPMSLPRRNLSDEEVQIALDVVKPKSIAEMSVEEKRSIADLSFMSDEEVATLTELDFSLLNADVQTAALGYRLFEVVALSRDREEKQLASERNAQMSAAGHPLRDGYLVHSTPTVGNLRNILLSGAVCGEAVGLQGRADHYPFNLDTVELAPGSTEKTYAEAVRTLDAESYGAIGIVFRRGEGSLHEGEEFSAQSGIQRHRLLFGGLPATEISAIALRSPVEEPEVIALKNVIIESDLYIPLYAVDGTLLLSYEDWQAVREDRNFNAAQPEVMDSSFRRPESQGGSNDGAEFVFARQTDGAAEDVLPTDRVYVKFGDSNPDHVWSELLTDTIYRTVNPDMAPETFPVIVEGRFGRAARWLEGQVGASQEAINAGFVLDCLVANWDAVFNSQNTVMHNGVAVRIDNGGALDFRARGSKKGGEGTEQGGTTPFGETVPELESGTSSEQLGRGMRQMYPGLTDEQVREQAQEMKDKLTDEVIDQLVDGIRRSSEDREMLKRTLKARRDYILERVGITPAS